MNIAAILAMLVQAGLCAPVEFSGPDGAQLTVLVCPMLTQPKQSAPPIVPPADVGPGSPV